MPLQAQKDHSWLFTSPLPELMAKLGTGEKGLGHPEALLRFAEHGRNEIPTGGKRHALHILTSQFSNALILILIAAAAISFLLGEAIEAAVILAIVLFNALLGFVQEYRAERALEELKGFLTMKAKVMREGEVIEVDSRYLVPGDVVYLNIGDIVPADMRLVWCEDFAVDESALTGESVPALKNPAERSDIIFSGLQPQAIRNSAFMGTVVASGEAHCIVVATGKATFFGRAASLLEKEEPSSEFERSIRQFSAFLLKITVFMTAFIFAANYFLGKGVLDSFVFAIALAVGITPEVLPVVMTISLSHGALKMAKKSVVVKRLSAMESLGNIDTLCCDKTGTLTEDSLRLERFENLDGKKDSKVLTYAILCNSAKMTKGKKLIGRGVDKAILQSGEAKNLMREVERFTVVDVNGFDFGRRRMSVLAREGKSKILIAKGAPDSILAISSHVVVNGKKRKFDSPLIARLRAKAEAWEKGGLLVIAVAEKQVEKATSHKEDETGMALTGFLMFSDPPKPSAGETLRHLQDLGVGVKILSGDSQFVTRKICSDVGLGIAEDKIVSGSELEDLSPQEADDWATRYNVFARLTPEQKHAIVRSLNREGHVVGFLGDGVNDTPALKAADVGISVDSGTDVAKDAADVILLHKSLTAVAAGITEGRKTFSNIMKYITNTVSANYGNMFTVAFSSLFLKFIPLLPSQILLNNFLTDFPMIAVSTDNVDAKALHKPGRWSMSYIRKFMYVFGILSSAFDLLLIVVLIAIFGATEGVFRTSWFMFSALTELVVLFSLRTRLPFYKGRPSRWLLVISGVTALLCVLIPLSTFGKAFFGFEAPQLQVFALMTGLLALYFLVVEFAKLALDRKLHAEA